MARAQVLRAVRAAYDLDADEAEHLLAVACSVRKVWILDLDHRWNRDITVHATREAAYHFLYEWLQRDGEPDRYLLDDERARYEAAVREGREHEAIEVYFQYASYGGDTESYVIFDAEVEA